MQAASTIARALHTLLLGLWLGSGIQLLLLEWMVSQVVDSRHQAGEVALTALAWFEPYALLAVPLLLFTLAVGWSGHRTRTRLWLIVILGVTVALTRYWARPECERLRAALGRPIEGLSTGDPTLAEVQWALGILGGLLWIQVAAAFVLFLASVLPSQPRRRAGISL